MSATLAIDLINRNIALQMEEVGYGWYWPIRILVVMEGWMEEVQTVQKELLSILRVALPTSAFWIAFLAYRQRQRKDTIAILQNRLEKMDQRYDEMEQESHQRYQHLERRSQDRYEDLRDKYEGMLSRHVGCEAKLEAMAKELENLRLLRCITTTCEERIIDLRE